MAHLLMFSSAPTAPTLGDPIVKATEHVRIAVADFAIAIQAATTRERVQAIRRQIAARVLELEAIEHMATDRDITLERVERIR